MDALTVHLGGRSAATEVDAYESGAGPASQPMIGTHRTMQTLSATIDRCANSRCNVLIVGETGTGKDVVANRLHQLSARRAAAFVAINCGALPAALISSELFGHVRGAFTGATHDQLGLFRQAHGGTLFLDEIGELPRDLQPTLLRVLENRAVRPVGGVVDVGVDVRVIAATNRTQDLGTEGSRLRLDLYHRLATVVIDVPPLRERRSDIPALVQYFLRSHGRPPTCVEPATWPLLMAHEWPGNVRELAHAVARASALGDAVLDASDFLPPSSLPSPMRRLVVATTGGRGDDLTPLEAIWRQVMTSALARHRTMRAAARALGMPKSTFAVRAHAWGIAPKPRRRITPG